jgi:hypothetical protein
MVYLFLHRLLRFGEAPLSAMHDAHLRPAPRLAHVIAQFREDRDCLPREGDCLVGFHVIPG